MPVIQSRWLLFVVLAATIVGCQKKQTGVAEFTGTSQPQSGSLYLQLDFPVDYVVDSTGKRMKIDGIEVVLDGVDFERKIQPLLGPQDKKQPQQFVRVVGSFAFEKDSVTIGVVQTEDGADEEVRTYWVASVKDVESAAWHRMPSED